MPPRQSPPARASASRRTRSSLIACVRSIASAQRLTSRALGDAVMQLEVQRDAHRAIGFHRQRVDPRGQPAEHQTLRSRGDRRQRASRPAFRVPRGRRSCPRRPAVTGSSPARTARGRLSSSPSNWRRSSASVTGRKLMPSSAASCRRETACPSTSSPRADALAHRRRVRPPPPGLRFPPCALMA